MGFNNPDMTWSELERRLSDGRPRNTPPTANGGDSPAWSRKRQPYEPPPPPQQPHATTPYAELHCHSNFSFLDGACHPEELVEEAARLGLEALALTDHDGFYGVVRFAEAARAVGLPTIFGAELTLDLHRTQGGVADPEGTHILVSWPGTPPGTHASAGRSARRSGRGEGARPASTSRRWPTSPARPVTGAC